MQIRTLTYAARELFPSLRADRSRVLFLLKNKRLFTSEKRVKCAKWFHRGYIDPGKLHDSPASNPAAAEPGAASCRSVLKATLLETLHLEEAPPQPVSEGGWRWRTTCVHLHLVESKSCFLPPGVAFSAR